MSIVWGVYLWLTVWCQSGKKKQFLPLGLSSRRGIVVACVRLSVRPASRNIWLVRTISQKPLLGITPNLVCTCILPSFRSILVMGDIDLHLQGHLALKDLKFRDLGLVRTIRQKVLDGISPNLHRICILLSFQHLLNMNDLDLHLQGHLVQNP